jgi:excisionase family DNA binding protein
VSGELATTPSNKGARQRLLTIDEVAELLAVPPSHVRGLIFKKRIPYIKVGKYVRFEQGAVDAFLEAGRVECQS